MIFSALAVIAIILYIIIGLIFGIIVTIEGHWPNYSNKFKTVVGFIIFGPLFWVISAIIAILSKVASWLSKE
ncbi:MAG TPA: hypothetical protein ENK70_05880 [Methylophaga sp.]|nr:hypothetical protein [Methylophaga sp.]